MFNKDKFIKEQTEAYKKNMIKSGMTEATLELEKAMHTEILNGAEVTENEAFMMGMIIGSNASKQIIEEGLMSPSKFKVIQFEAMTMLR